MISILTIWTDKETGVKTTVMSAMVLYVFYLMGGGRPVQVRDPTGKDAQSLALHPPNTKVKYTGDNYEREASSVDR